MRCVQRAQSEALLYAQKYSNILTKIFATWGKGKLMHKHLCRPETVFKHSYVHYFRFTS